MTDRVGGADELVIGHLLGRDLDLSALHRRLASVRLLLIENGPRFVDAPDPDRDGDNAGDRRQICVIRNVEGTVFQPRVDLRHHLFPHRGRRVAVIGDSGGIVVADPDRRDVIRRISHEPAVVSVLSGARLSCNRHVVQIRDAARAVGSGLLHHVGHPVGGLVADGLYLFRLIFVDQLVVVVVNVFVGAPLRPDTVVHEHRIGGRHVPDGHAVAQGADRHGRVVHVLDGQRGYAGLASHELEADGGRELVHQLGCDGIDGVFQRRLDRDDSHIGIVEVQGHPGRSVELDVLPVLDLRVRRYDGILDGRSVGRYGLEGGPRLPSAAGRSVPPEISGLFSDPSAHSDDVSGIGILDHDCGLRLLTGAGYAGYIVRIPVHRIDDRLDLRVHRRNDLVASGKEQQFRSSLGDVLEFGQILDEIVAQRFLEPRVDGVVHHVFAGVENERLADGRVIFLLGDILQFEHLPEDQFLTVLVALSVDERTVHRRIVGDAHDAGRLGQREFADLLAEIIPGSRADPVASVAEIDHVQIQFYDLFLAVVFLVFQCAEDLQELSGDRNVVLVLDVLDQLLCDG